MSYLELVHHYPYPISTRSTLLYALLWLYILQSYTYSYGNFVNFRAQTQIRPKNQFKVTNSPKTQLSLFSYIPPTVYQHHQLPYILRCDIA